MSYNIVNIENIPYENNRFDKVITNMMLYHVPELHKGLSEAKRVLSDDGYFYCATYGENGIVPFIAGLLRM
ncbi:MAG: class I SAM-dependent methyltransferase [Lachnospiraceae bacterium]|nr:class I SAM-dependent methyltransferase [Lachnospiraceae bacterium]